MEINCGFSKNNKRFRYRAGGIIIYDDKILFVKSAFDDYYYIIGGGVWLGETSQNCLEREIFEETGMKVKAESLTVVCENFFKGHDGKVNDLDCHTLEFYYRIHVTDEEFSKCNNLTDNGENLVWLTLPEIEQSIIKPTCIKERINEILKTNQIIHIIEERDR